MVQIKRSLLTTFKMVAFTLQSILCFVRWPQPGKIIGDLSTITLYRLTFSVFFDGVKCQDRLLIPDWIWLQSADAAACNTSEKACSCALNALVLTVESQASGRALGHSSYSHLERWPAPTAQRGVGNCQGMERPIRKLKTNKQKEHQWRHEGWQLGIAGTLSA